MNTKVGVYICKGCDIAKCLDVDKLVEVATEKGATLAKTCDVCCTPETVSQIKSDIESQGLDRIVIGACSQRVFPELFDFGDKLVTERTPLREYVAWSHEPNDEDTQLLAEDYVRMGIAKVDATKPPEPLIEEISKDIMVVGGGVTGMTAAKAAADAGYKVTLVEKSDQLGGWGTRFKKVFPKKPPYRDLQDLDLDQLIKDIEGHDNITVHMQTEVEKTAGQPGKFAVALKNGSRTEMTVGSIILATGWKEYDASKLTHLGYGSSPDILTNVQFEDLVKENKIKRPSDGKPIESIAFIQCAGSRDQDHLPYCSAVCCRVSLKQALYVREQYPDAKIYVIYKDIRSPQQFEQFYANCQEDEGIFFTKGEIANVAPDGNQIVVDVEETLLGEDIKVKTDMVVLATGMVPTTKVEDATVPIEPDASEEAETDEETGMTSDGKKEAAGAEKGAKILNLTYRQGTDLPTLKYGFPDSHFICFPYETRRTGIYAAGPVRSPMDFASSASDAYGAALKSIQAVEAIARGQAVHPRAGDMTYPEFFLQRCTQCKRCTEECPFGALDEDDKGTPLPNPLRCRRCGVCLGACPERIISFNNYNIH
ncbi:FAD-dependent oxidoreductase, partial [candidate division GN15 bacterium]|nr:FAD-dependent oxidoreductase [candidate division GN15 bacterium]